MANLGKPLADRVLLKLESVTEKKSTGGIILNQTTATGEVVELSIKVGDSVLINNGSGQKLKLQGDEYHLVRESEILMIL